MAIHITCPGCFARFSVSDKFAGRDGPCPKCKTIITIPDKNEEVVIHAPEDAGPRDSQGRPVLKPIKRRENELTPLLITLIIAVIVGLLALALAVRFMAADKSAISIWWMALGAVVAAIPLVVAGYGFLRDQELGQFTGREFWLRAAICAVGYAASWAIFPLAHYTFDGWSLTSWITAAVVMMIVGTIVGMMCWELDVIPGALHFGLYFGSCLVLRWVAGVEFLPGMLEAGQPLAYSCGAMSVGWIVGVGL